MNVNPTGNLKRKTRPLALAISLLGGALLSPVSSAHEVKDLKYGAILFEFYQKKYFETLVEYEYARERGGIQNHGSYPQLLKGGVSLSYGLDDQAKDIFTRLIAEHSPEEIQNRAWFYLSKMLYLRGDTDRSANTMANIQGHLPEDIEDEYRYLAALINIKLGYFDEAAVISEGFDEDDSPFAPYLHFNLGVALGKQKQYERAMETLHKVTDYADESEALARLSDRAHMATAYLQAEQENFVDAYFRIKQVSATGVFSNRALLGSSWASVNSGAYREALAPLGVLQQRSMAIPEVQEAVLLMPHVYEKLGLPGRAANGFIQAYDRYQAAIDQLEEARESLKNADILELFVRNMGDMLDESDWFGTAPSVSLNALSPFLLELMSDHSFQSVLKDLRDLYAIRNNLESWKRKQDDFQVILEARSGSHNIQQRRALAAGYAEQLQQLEQRQQALASRVATLPQEERERVQWLLDDLQVEIRHARLMAEQLQESTGVKVNADSFVGHIHRNMEALHSELEKTHALIAQVENVMFELVNTELDIHQERLKYYQVQSQLAKVRILDRSLADIEAPASQSQEELPGEETPADGQDTNKAADAEGDKHAA